MTAAPCRANCRLGVEVIRRFYAINADLAFFSRFRSADGRLGADRAEAAHAIRPVGQCERVVVADPALDDQIEVSFIVGQQAAVNGIFRGKTERIEPAAPQPPGFRDDFEHR